MTRRAGGILVVDSLILIGSSRSSYIIRTKLNSLCHQVISHQAVVVCVYSGEEAFSHRCHDLRQVRLRGRVDKTNGCRKKNVQIYFSILCHFTISPRRVFQEDKITVALCNSPEGLCLKQHGVRDRCRDWLDPFHVGHQHPFLLCSRYSRIS